MRQFWLLPLVVAAAIVLALFARQPPTSSPDSGYSPVRAQQLLHHIARTPRTVGTVEHDKARDWLIGEFAALGLIVETQKGIGVRQANFAGRRKGAISVAPYENIIAVLPGRDRSLSAVAVMAHYDSVAYSNGASDDAAGVASVVESAIVLAKQPPLRDIVFLLTDAEELGLIGAQEFFDSHPLAKRIAAVVNIEARGSQGRAIMFQTSPGNGGLIDLWANSANSPSGNSMANAVYQRLPNDTDLSVPLAKGKIGINAAFIDGLADYHMPTDTIAHLDPDAMAHLGDFAITTTRALGNSATLPKARADSAYFDVFGLFVVHYPGIWTWGLIALGFVGLGVSSFGRLGVSPWQAVKATLGVLLLFAGTAAVAHLMGSAAYGPDILSIRDRISEMDLALWIFVALCSGATLMIQPRAAMWVGATIAVLLATIAAQIWLPGATWILIWGALLGVALIILAAFVGLNSPITIYTSAVLGGLWGALLLEGVITTYMTVAPLTPAPMALIIPFAMILIGPVIIEFCAANRGRIVGIILIGFAVIGTIWFAATDRFGPRYPKPGDLFHVTETQTGNNWWATTSGPADLPSKKAKKLHIAGFPKSGWHGVAAVAAITPRPNITISQSAGRTQLALESGIAPRSMVFMVKPGFQPAHFTVNGKAVNITAGKATRIAWRAETPGAVLFLVFDSVPGGIIDMDYLYSVPGLPPGAPVPAGPTTEWTALNASRVVTGTRRITL